MNGMLRYLRYGFSPNQLHYCGPRDSRAILDYLKAEKTDEGLRELLQKFQGALPYLKFIARQNHLEDPFDERVVEAYWLGNGLLIKCDLRKFYQGLQERFKKMVSQKILNEMLGGVPRGARPHHSFHVLHIFSQTGGMNKMLTPTLTMINNCMVRNGVIISKVKNQSSKIKVKSEKLAIQKNQLIFVPNQETLQIFNNEDLKPGDRVSFHWGWVCEKITLPQKRNLEKYNRLSVKIFI